MDIALRGVVDSVFTIRGDTLVIVDDREPKKIINKGRKYYPDLTVSRLLVGDVIHKNVCIERKTALDFAASVNDKRIYAQVANMKSNFEHSFVIMTGSFEDVRRNRYQHMTINRFIGAMADLAMYYHVPVLCCENDEQFWRYCDSIFRKIDGDAPKVVRKVNKYKGNGELSVLCGVPNLGEKRAHALLKRFRTIHDICHASKDDLMTVDGIGKKRANMIKKVFK